MDQDLKGVLWNEKSYSKFLELLWSNQDIQYQKFHRSLFKEDISNIGIRMPILKKYAKQISKGDYSSFFSVVGHQCYEETIIYGLVIGFASIEFSEKLKELDKFMIYNTNWAINDTVCANLKDFKNNKEDGFLYILECLKDHNPWKIRFGIVLLLDFYVEEKYIDDILLLSKKINVKEYYVQMAISWLLSICYIKFPEKTEKLLKDQILDPFVQNKTISKIKDSYRVTKDQKIELEKYRSKKGGNK